MYSLEWDIPKTKSNELFKKIAKKTYLRFWMYIRTLQFDWEEGEEGINKLTRYSKSFFLYRRLSAFRTSQKENNNKIHKGYFVVSNVYKSFKS